MQRDKLIDAMNSTMDTFRKNDKTAESTYQADENGAMSLYFMIRYAAWVLDKDGVYTDRIQEYTGKVTNLESDSALHWTSNERFYTYQLLKIIAWLLDPNDLANDVLDDIAKRWKHGEESAQGATHQIGNNCMRIFNVLDVIAQLLSETDAQKSHIQSLRQELNDWQEKSTSADIDIYNALVASFLMMQFCIQLLDPQNAYKQSCDRIWDYLLEQDDACQSATQQVANVSCRLVEMAPYFVLGLADTFGLPEG